MSLPQFLSSLTLQPLRPPVGTIALTATTAGERIRIKIADDGRGIEATIVAARARALGLLATEDSLDSDTAVLEMLCTPGFSTREQTDRASGRGMSGATELGDERLILILDSAAPASALGRDRSGAVEDRGRRWAGRRFFARIEK